MLTLCVRLPCCVLFTARLVADTDISCLTFSEFGKDFCKLVKVSPDSFVQIAIQLAFYKWEMYYNNAYYFQMQINFSELHVYTTC